MLCVRYTNSMKSAAFNKLIADAYSIAEKTVVVYARLLKEAGLMTTGARGRNAPDMTPMDAARITISLLASEKPTEAVEMCQRFRQLTHNYSYEVGEVVGCGDANFLEDIEHFLEAFFTGCSPQNAALERIEVNAELQNVRLTFAKGSTLFDGTADDVQAVYDEGRSDRLQTIRALNVWTLNRIAVEFLKEQEAL